MAKALKTKAEALKKEIDVLLTEMIPPVPAQKPEDPRFEMIELDSYITTMGQREAEISDRVTEMTTLEEKWMKILEKGNKADQEAAEAFFTDSMADLDWESVLSKARKGRRTVQQQITKARNRYQQIQEAIPAQQPPPAAAQQPAAQRSLQLEPIKLEPFTGKLRDWQLFYQRFMASIDKQEMDPADKYQYLLSLLRGEALSIVKGLAPRADNYKVALGLLKDKYDDKESYSGELIDQFHSLKACRSFSDVRQFQIDLEVLCRQLETLGENLNSSIICSLLESKLNYSFVKEIQKSKAKENAWNTDKFRKKLSELVKQEEASQRTYYRQHNKSLEGEHRSRRDQRSPKRSSARERSPNDISHTIKTKGQKSVL